MADKLEFKKGDFVVYPAHGVGRVEGVDAYSIAGQEDVMLYSIAFEQDRMRLKVPVTKASSAERAWSNVKSPTRTAIPSLRQRSRTLLRVTPQNVTMSVGVGSFHALLGENGAGKSTLVKCLVGFYQPDGGQILFETTRSGSLQIWRLELESRRLIQVTHDAGGARAPVWRGKSELQR